MCFLYIFFQQLKSYRVFCINERNIQSELEIKNKIRYNNNGLTCYDSRKQKEVSNLQPCVLIVRSVNRPHVQTENLRKPPDITAIRKMRWIETGKKGIKKLRIFVSCIATKKYFMKQLLLLIIC